MKAFTDRQCFLAGECSTPPGSGIAAAVTRSHPAIGCGSTDLKTAGLSATPIAIRVIDLAPRGRIVQIDTKASDALIALSLTRIRLRTEHDA